MTIEERINLQKNKEIPNRLQTASNNDYKEIDRYIISHLQLKQDHQQEQMTEYIKKIIEKEIEDIFKK